jgi:hypothetical protein
MQIKRHDRSHLVELRDVRMAHLARRYTQDLAVAADDRHRRRRHRRRNLFARADRSLERVTGASDKR